LQTEKIKILYVDDEENNLNSFKAFFRKYYEIYIAKNAAEALRIIESIPVEIILSDQRMPATTGVEFLEKTIPFCPNSIRILITGQSDIDVVIDAINRGQVFKYIQKPWDWEKLSLIIENAAQTFQSQKEINSKNIELQKLNNELNKFVYSVSHDLRSPLMSILGVLELSKLEEKSFNPTYIKIIEDCVLKLDSYLKNIIDYYVNSKSDELLQDINFQELINEILKSHNKLDDAIFIETEVKQNAEFIGDLFRIKVVLNNLISNAIKFKNPENLQHKIQIIINANLKSVYITISDNGIGILQEHLEHIFKMFFRTLTPNEKQGSGIGLYIVKEALEKIGGTIEVASSVETGTSFKIFIPNKGTAK
jgi:signal transduction histidine kinase